MSKTKEELILSLRETISKNPVLNDLFLGLSEKNKQVEALKILRKEYPYIYDDVINLIAYDPKGEENLIKDMVSVN